MINARRIKRSVGSPYDVRPENLHVWFENGIGGNIVFNGSAVAGWVSRTSNKIAASQTTAGNQPAYVASIFNGRPSIKFDGVNDSLAHAVLSQPVHTVFLAGRYISQAAISSILYTNGNRALVGWAFLLDSNNVRNLLYGNVATKPGASTTFQNEIYSEQWDGITSRFFMDGAAQSITASTTAPPIPVGAAYIGTDELGLEPASMHLSELIVYNTNLSAAEIKKVETYLSRKLGMRISA